MISVRAQRCPQNHPCPVVPRCPVGAIVQQGWGAPQIDRDVCTDCGACARMCSTFARNEKSS